VGRGWRWFEGVWNKNTFVQTNYFKVLNGNFIAVENWIENNLNFEWVKPDAGSFIQIKKQIDTKNFYETLLNTHQTMLGPGHWFE
jgi:hypothetical protein